MKDICEAIVSGMKGVKHNGGSYNFWTIDGGSVVAANAFGAAALSSGFTHVEDGIPYSIPRVVQFLYGKFPEVKPPVITVVDNKGAFFEMRCLLSQIAKWENAGKAIEEIVTLYRELASKIGQPSGVVSNGFGEITLSGPTVMW